MNNTSKVLIGLIVIMASVLIVLLVLIFKEKNRQSVIPNQQQVSNLNQQQVSKEKKYPSDLQGKVYLTLRAKDAQNIGIYYFDLTSRELIEVNVPQDCMLVGGGLNSIGNKMAVSSNCESENPEIFQIYANDIGKNSTVITKSLNDFKKEATWSPDNKKIAFSLAAPAVSVNPNPELKISAWNIFTSDLEGNEQFIVNGSHPFFSPDGKKILVLREKGIFLVDIETASGELVHFFEKKMESSMHLGLSEQKDRLAVSDPYNRNITIFNIKSWDNFEMEEIQKIETEDSYVSWPKFSPSDQKYLITQAVFDDKSVGLVAYDLETKEQYFILDLSEYMDTSLWINDWR